MTKLAVTILSLFIFNFSFANTEASAEKAHGKGMVEHHPETLFPQPKANPAKRTIPGKAALIEPKFLAKITGTSTTLKWSPVAGAENYHLQVATDPNFKWLTVDNHFQKTVSFELSGLEAGKTYYWRVAAVKNSNNSMYTNSYFDSSSFEVSK